MAYRPTSKVTSPLKTSWFPSKDKEPMENKSGAIYWFQCRDLACDKEYIGETSRTFGERFKEHLLSHSSLVVSKLGCMRVAQVQFPPAVTTRTATGGDTEHVYLNHWLAPPYQGVKFLPAKCWEDSYRHWPWVGCKQLLFHHLKVMAHTKVGWVPYWELKCKVVR